MREQVIDRKKAYFPLMDRSQKLWRSSVHFSACYSSPVSAPDLKTNEGAVVVDWTYVTEKFGDQIAIVKVPFAVADELPKKAAGVTALTADFGERLSKAFEAAAQRAQQQP
jgi:hypothetical protein